MQYKLKAPLTSLLRPYSRPKTSSIHSNSQAFHAHSYFHSRAEFDADSRHLTSPRTLPQHPFLPPTSRKSRIATPAAILHVGPQRLPYEAATTVVATALPEVRYRSRLRSSGPISWDQRGITGRSYLLVPQGTKGVWREPSCIPRWRKTGTQGRYEVCLGSDMITQPGDNHM